MTKPSSIGTPRQTSELRVRYAYVTHFVFTTVQELSSRLQEAYIHQAERSIL